MAEGATPVEAVPSFAWDGDNIKVTFPDGTSEALALKEIPLGGGAMEAVLKTGSAVCVTGARGSNSICISLGEGWGGFIWKDVDGTVSRPGCPQGVWCGVVEPPAQS